MTTRSAAERTLAVLAHVQAERAMQREDWYDDDKTDADWDGLLDEWLTKVSTTSEKRYVRLIQLAAIAVAAAEAQR